MPSISQMRHRFSRLALIGSIFVSVPSTSVAQDPEPRNRRAVLRTDSAMAVPLMGAFDTQSRAQAVLRFEVDSTGRPKLRRESVLSETYQIAGAAGYRAVNQWRFLPARRNGIPTADTVQVTIDFLPAPNKGMAILAPQLLEARSDGVGNVRVVVGSTPQQVDAPPLAASEQANVAIAALDSLFTFEVTRRVHSRPGGGTGRPDSPLTVRTACITMTVDGKEVEPTTQQMVRLTQPYLGVVPQRRCPPTFGSMVRVVGAPDGPEGDDPWSFRVAQPRVWATDTVLVDASWKHATAFGTNHCVVIRESVGVDSSKWRARCVQGSMGVH